MYLCTVFDAISISKYLLATRIGRSLRHNTLSFLPSFRSNNGCLTHDEVTVLISYKLNWDFCIRS